MPLNRDYLLAEKSTYRLDENEDLRLRDELRQIHDPQPKSFWIDQIKDHSNVSDTKANYLFSGLVLDRFLLFLRIYRGDPIYVNSTTPVWFHDKMPVLILES